MLENIEQYFFRPMKKNRKIATLAAIGYGYF